MSILKMRRSCTLHHTSLLFFLIVVSMCVVHISLLSTITPQYVISLGKSIFPPSSLMSGLVLIFLAAMIIRFVFVMVSFSCVATDRMLILHLGILTFYLIQTSMRHLQTNQNQNIVDFFLNIIKMQCKHEGTQNVGSILLL